MERELLKQDTAICSFCGSLRPTAMGSGASICCICLDCVRRAAEVLLGSRVGIMRLLPEEDVTVKDPEVTP